MQIKLINTMREDIPYSYQILSNRGVDLNNIEQFLNTTDEVINDYKNLDNIDLGVKTLLKHIGKGNKILIQVDADVDGYTSAAVLYNYLRSNFPNANLYYQVHDEKMHGLEITEDILNNEYQLIIVPDAGSNEYDKHKILKDKDIDIIILDHHEAELSSENAIVINNQLSPRYTNKALSGVGVVWQFCRALDDIIADEKDTIAEDYLDLVALGLIADMMDTKELETKRLIEKGIEQMKEGMPIPRNYFLECFIKKQAYSLKNTVTPTGLAWFIAPFINAVVRVGSPEERLLTFEAMLQENEKKIVPSTKRGCKGQEETLVEQAIRTLTNVKNRQKNQTDELLSKYEPKITDEYLEQNSIITIIIDNSINPNLKGLVANKISAKYLRPTFILSEDEIDGVVYYFGSGRNIETPILPDLRNFVLDSGFAEYCEGHGNAHGVKFTKENFEKFNIYANEKLNFQDSYTEYKVDFIFNKENLRPEIILDIASLNDYWGQGIKEALIAGVNIPITESDKLLMSKDKNPTLKLNLNGIESIKFKSSEEEFDSIAPNGYTTTVIDFVGKCTLNVWNGNTKPQIMIEDYEVKNTIISF